ncbi:MAG: anti-sigma factor antagonist [Acidobacteria bacterium]|nr:anti-sigma factor antagonist [Acidobacteriota bacterium]
MLKITLHDTAGEFRLTLEGRLAGAWVRELELCWRTASSTTSGRQTVVDLSDVDFVDQAGQELLTQMHSAKVELVGQTPLICSMLDEVCRSGHCARVGGRNGTS